MIEARQDCAVDLGHRQAHRSHLRNHSLRDSHRRLAHYHRPRLPKIERPQVQMTALLGTKRTFSFL
jgi:hypothetical protein